MKKPEILSDEEIKDAIGREYDERYPLVRAPMSDLDCYRATAQAQRDDTSKKTLEQVIKYIETEGKYNLSAITQLDLFNSPMWKKLQSQVEEA